MTVTDWSRLVLEGALFDDVPAWAVPAGLYALGFGEQMLTAVSDRFKRGGRQGTRDGPEVAAFAARLAERANKAAPGLLDIVSRPESLLGLPEWDESTRSSATLRRSNGCRAWVPSRRGRTMDFDEKHASPRMAVIAALPKSIQDLPSLEYRRRAARTREESLSDVEYGVASTRDLGKVFRKRKK